MKLGPIEGTKEEVTGFFQDNGLNVKDYFQMPETPIGVVWIVIPAIPMIIALGTLTLIGPLSTGQKMFAFLLGCAALVWLTTVIQLRFKHAWATGIVAIGGLLLMLVAIGAISPTQMLNEANYFRK